MANTELTKRLEFLESHELQSAQGFVPADQSPSGNESGRADLPSRDQRNKQQQWQCIQHKQLKQQQQLMEPSLSKGDKSRLIMYIRRVSRDTQIVDVVQHLRRQQGIAVNELQIMQTVLMRNSMEDGSSSNSKVHAQFYKDWQRLVRRGDCSGKLAPLHPHVRTLFWTRIHCKEDGRDGGSPQHHSLH